MRMRFRYAHATREIVLEKLESQRTNPHIEWSDECSPNDLMRLSSTPHELHQKPDAQKGGIMGDDDSKRLAIADDRKAELDALDKMRETARKAVARLEILDELDAIEEELKRAKAA
jgi:hypothetical protein